MIVAALNEEGQDNPQPQAQVDLAAKEAVATKTIADFVKSSSRRIFAAFNVSMDFLAKDPSEWENYASFQSSQQVIWRRTAANDFTERGVALIQDYIQILTKDEEQHRLLSSISISFLMQRQDSNSNMTLHNWPFIGPVNNTMYFMLLFSTVDKSVRNKKRFLFHFCGDNSADAHMLKHWAHMLKHCNFHHSCDSG